MELQYVDPILSNLTKSSNPEDHDNIDDDELSAQSINEIMKNFLDPSHHNFGQYDRIVRNCHHSLKLYKFFINLKYNELNSWEFLILKTSVNLNFNYEQTSGSDDQRGSFDINIARKCIDKCSDLDDILDGNADAVDKLVAFIQRLSIQEYISDPGTLLIKVYFKILNLKNQIVEQISIFYTKSKLLIISYELNEIVRMIEQDDNPIVADETDYKSTLESYKNFVKILIDQLDQAVADKDSEQIEECLNILNDVEKMYESVRMQFFYTEEINEMEEEFLNEYNEQQRLLEDSMMSSTGFDQADDFADSVSSVDELVALDYNKRRNNMSGRRTSISSTTSTLHSQFNPQKKTTISEELPYLLQAFDEAKHLEQELKEYNSYTKPQQQQQQTSRPYSSSSSSSTPSSSTPTAITAPYTPLSPTLPQSSMFSMSPASSSYSLDKRSSLQAGFTGSSMGFGSSLLNNIYGLHPKGKVFAPSSLHNQVD